MAVPAVTETLQVATIRIKGVSALLFGKMVDKNEFPKKAKETHDAYEQRTWRERAHAAPDGRIYVPAFALKRMLENTARHQGDKITGQGQKTWAKKLQAGIQVESDLIVDPPVLKKEVDGLWKHVPSGGKPGGGTRVPRCFPILQDWGGEFRVLLLDEFIQRDIIERYAVKAGIVNGLGVWRPQNGGSFGRFKVEGITWSEYEF